MNMDNLNITITFGDEDCNDKLDEEYIEDEDFFEDVAIEDVQFHGNTTIVFWDDGSVTTVCEGPDKEKGLAMAILKRIAGNDESYRDVFEEFCE